MLTVLLYADCHASKLFTMLKSLYEPQGATAEFYAQCTYERIKLSKHNNFDSYMTTLINATHQFNKEISDVNGHIKNHDIAMRIIHALPTPLFSLQTILLESAPPSDKTNWDLQALHQHITSAEEWARAAGLKLGTKLDILTDPKALAVQDDTCKGRKNDSNWVSHQTCWVCGKVSHLRRKCTMSQAERKVYKDKKNAEHSEMGAQATTEQASTEQAAAKPEVYIADAEPSAFNAGGDPSNPKSWLIDSGCTSHLSPNWSDFISYPPYDMPCSVQLGNGSSTPLLGEGIISLECLVNSAHITH